MNEERESRSQTLTFRTEMIVTPDNKVITVAGLNSYEDFAKRMEGQKGMDFLGKNDPDSLLLKGRVVRLFDTAHGVHGMSVNLLEVPNGNNATQQMLLVNNGDAVSRDREYLSKLTDVARFSHTLPKSKDLRGTVDRNDIHPAISQGVYHEVGRIEPDSGHNDRQQFTDDDYRLLLAETRVNNGCYLAVDSTWLPSKEGLEVPTLPMVIQLDRKLITGRPSQKPLEVLYGRRFDFKKIKPGYEFIVP